LYFILTYNAFQIYIADIDNCIESSLPASLREIANVFRSSLPTDHSYTLYNKEMLRDFIYDFYGNEVLNAYDKLKPYSYKADLCKYCISYKLGGWYSDLTIKIISKLPAMDEDCELICFRDLGAGLNPGSINYGIQASFFYSKKNNKIFEKAIDYVVENCNKENYGKSPVCPTGPGVFGRAFAYFGAQKNQVLGSYLPLTPALPIKNRVYLVPNGKIYALHKDAWMPQSKPGSMDNFGVKGTNNYVAMYQARDIYEV